MTRLRGLVDWALGDDVLAGVDQAVLVVTDTVAAIVGAAVEPEVAGFGAAAPHLGGQGASTVLATGARTSAYAAALANGQAAVRLELDEGNQFAANHPSVRGLDRLVARS
jgi:2-methylcitrate dehydratase PrpD